MTGLGQAIGAYCRHVGASVRGQLQYRASTVMLALGQLVATAIEFVAIWALFERFGTLRGWTLAEIALLYGMTNVAFALAEAFGRGFDVFDQMVRTGEFDRLLLRPLGTALQVGATHLQLARAGRLVQGAVVLAWAARALAVDWGAVEAALLGAAIAAGTCIFVGLFVLQATVAFWTIEGLEIANTVTYGGVATTQYPLPIYDPWLRKLFVAVVPLACASYFPALALLGRSDPLGAPDWLPWIAPAIGPLFLFASLRIWRLGVRHYRSTGS
jgi:ABC-2 type transport system permease protein